MNVIADFTLVPIGVGVSVSSYVAACQEVLEASGLSYVLHANGTNIEGEWDQVMQVLKACHEKVHAMGAPRIHSTLSLGTRTDHGQNMEDKIQSVQRQLES